MNKEADLATRPWRIRLFLQSKGVYATFAGIRTPACPQRVPILGLSSSPGMVLQKTDDADLHLLGGSTRLLKACSYPDPSQLHYIGDGVYI